MLSDYLSPINLDFIKGEKDFTANNWGSLIDQHTDQNFPELDGVKMAIIGVQEDRGSWYNEGAKDSPDYVRKSLYFLNRSLNNLELIDLGNIKQGNKREDTHYALKTVLAQLVNRNIIPIIIGGGHDLTFSQYCGYEELNQTVNLVVFDEKINIAEGEGLNPSDEFLMELFMHQPNYLFNFSVVGYQSYYIEPNTLAALEKLHFDCHRLGKFKNNIEEIEAIIRDSDMISFDMSCIRQSDAPAHREASPNGFYGEQACQIARYAGISDKVSSFGIYELNPEFDNNYQSSQLAAQMIWYFVDGFYHRQNDNPYPHQKHFQKYYVDLKVEEHELIFWKSQQSGRWWMEVPYDKEKERFKRHHLVSCTYSDYQSACEGDVPDRWITAFEKLL